MDPVDLAWGLGFRVYRFRFLLRVHSLGSGFRFWGFGLSSSFLLFKFGMLLRVQRCREDRISSTLDLFVRLRLQF